MVKPRNDETKRPKHTGMPYLKDIHFTRKKRLRRTKMSDLFECQDKTALAPLCRSQKVAKTEDIKPFKPKYCRKSM